MVNGKFALGEWRDIKKIAQSITRAENGDPVEYQINWIRVARHSSSPGGGREDGTCAWHHRHRRRRKIFCNR